MINGMLKYYLNLSSDIDGSIAFRELLNTPSKSFFIIAEFERLLTYHTVPIFRVISVPCIQFEFPGIFEV